MTLRWLLLAPLLLTACDSGGGGDADLPQGTFLLEQVAGRELPAARVDKSVVCDEGAPRDYYLVTEDRAGTLRIDGDSVELTFEQRTLCENLRSSTVTTEETYSGRVQDGRVTFADGSLMDLRGSDDSVTATLTGFDGGDREVTFGRAVEDAPLAGTWSGSVEFALDTTYATRISPDEPRRQQLWRRYDVELDLDETGTTIGGRARIVYYFERISTTLSTGEVRTIGSRTEPQGVIDRAIAGTGSAQRARLDLRGDGVLLDWEQQPFILRDGALRSALRNFGEGSYFSDDAGELVLTRQAARRP